ncbi:MAG: response regulator transcription factor [Schleiferiaceae bacterium]|jgi:DNA-binding NarL/FixJ family response regulator|nr:response regulator transcription factor [Schleiferiaceae bacterium]
MIKVIIADDHAILTKGVKMFIENINDIEIIGEANNGNELVDLLKKEKANVILMDIDMPEMNGISALRHVDQKYPFTKVVMLSMHPEEIYGKTARKMGAVGYVSKSSDPAKIIEAIRAASRGELYFNEEMHSVKSNELGALRKLSKRESEVLQLISSGKSNKFIAEQLDISDKTVSTYKVRLMTKLGAKSVVDLVHFSKNYPLAR